MTTEAVSRRDWRWAFLCAIFFLFFTVCGSLFAQNSAPANEGDSAEAEDDASQRVDESEENFRTRMELRDQRYREQPRADMTYSSQGGGGKLDQLPEASRQHIKDQMRDMIMDSRQWKPGEDLSDYPYEPSPAAQSDAKLSKQEREAWVEQLQKYQQREAAAYADAKGGKEGQQGGQEGGQGSESADKQGANDSAGANSEAAGQSQANSASAAESSTSRSHEAETISTAGVSESALSFLQGKGGQAGGEGPQSDAAEDASDNPSTELSTASPAAPGTQQPSGDQRSDNSPAPETDAETLAGTLIIDDLKNMSGGTSQDLQPSAPGSATGAAALQSADTPAEPGTLDIDELKRLGGDG